MKKDHSLKTRLYKFCSENLHNGRSYVAKHFIDEGVTKSTVYSYISSYLEIKKVEKKKRSDRIAFITTKKNIRKLKKLMDRVSLRKCARRFNCHHNTILKILKEHTDIKVLKKKQIDQSIEGE